MQVEIQTHRLIATNCPQCGAFVDAATGGTKPPRPGDLFICCGCKAVNVYQRGGGLRVPNERELKCFSLIPELREHIKVAQFAASLAKLGKKIRKP